MRDRPLRPRSDGATLARRLGARTGVGLAVGLLVVAADQVLPPVPLSLPSVRTLLGALVAAVVTAGVFSLWMRTVAIGLVSDQFSPRTLVVFLDDGFQVRLAGWMLAVLTVQVVVLAAFPDDEAAGVPAASLVVAPALTLVAVAAVLYAVTHAVRSVDLTRLVARLADEVRRVRDAQVTGAPTLRPPEVADQHPVHAAAAGWVVGIDRDAVLAALPPGGRARLETHVGDFVARGEPVAWLELPDRDPRPDARPAGDRGPEPSRSDDAGPDLDLLVAVREAVQVRGDARSNDDLSLAISQLVDVADDALSQPGADTSTAHEALMQLSAVGCELLESGLPSGHRHDADRDRWVVDRGAWDVSDHLRVAVERLRAAAARDPLAARHLAAVVVTLQDHAREVGDTRSAATMRRQLRHLVSLAEAAGAIDEDLDLLRTATGLDRDDEPDEHDGPDGPDEPDEHDGPDEPDQHAVPDEHAGPDDPDEQPAATAVDVRRGRGGR